MYLKSYPQQELCVDWEGNRCSVQGEAHGAPTSVITCDSGNGEHEEGKGISDGGDAGALMGTAIVVMMDGDNVDGGDGDDGDETMIQLCCWFQWW